MLLHFEQLLVLSVIILVLEAVEGVLGPESEQLSGLVQVQLQLPALLRLWM